MAESCPSGQEIAPGPGSCAIFTPLKERASGGPVRVVDFVRADRANKTRACDGSAKKIAMGLHFSSCGFRRRGLDTASPKRRGRGNANEAATAAETPTTYLDARRAKALGKTSEFFVLCSERFLKIWYMKGYVGGLVHF
ncbi:hypothetical protein JI664_02315, partial [Rhodobacter sp. NTK016B]|uniref:hypothetical protein n=1 Tax=Rhodobacter sp. NTK016B TaxID=2759676 RepID=UPI001A8E871C